MKNTEQVASKEDQLVSMLSKIIIEHQESISIELFESLNALKIECEKKGLSLTDPDKEQPTLIFGNANFSILLGRYIDPHLEGLKALLHGPLRLDDILAKCSSLNFKSNNISSYCDNLLNLSKYIVDNLTLYIDLNAQYKVSENLTVIRLLVLNIYSLSSPASFKKCKVCYRRIIKNKYCWRHKSGSASFYNQAKKVSKFQSAGVKKFIETWNSKREFIGDEPKIFPAVKGINNETVSAYQISVPVVVGMYDLIQNITQSCWEKASQTIESLVVEEFPFVAKMISGQTEKANSFNQYTNRIYGPKFLDNRYEVSTSGLWFIVMLIEAESWLEAEFKAQKSPDLRTKDTAERDKEVIKLRSRGLSYRKIANEINASKSLVEKICKS